MSIADHRRDYFRTDLSEADAAADPIAQLRSWIDQAVDAGVQDATAMVLGTTTPDARPSARVVLLKGLDARGLVFYSNHLSRKGLELAANPWAAVVFFWPQVERQVRAEGAVETVSAEEADEYFRSRPKDSQLAAWASDQSGVVVGGRAELDRRLSEVASRFGAGEITRPPHWGGYRLKPNALEFWQGRPGRLHDRLRYSPVPDAVGEWYIERLAP